MPRLWALLAVQFFAGDGSRFYAYDYSRHGQDWSMGMCASRSRQSPVDFPEGEAERAAEIAPNTPGGDALAYRYTPITTPFELMNNGRTYSADLGGQGYGGVAHEDAWYDLMNVNVHAVSEHTLAGQHLPLELHIVHKRYDGDALLIVAVTFESPGTAAATSLAQEAKGSERRLRGRTGSTSLAREAELSAQAPPDSNAVLDSFLGAALPAPHTSSTMPAEEAKPLDLNRLLEGGSFFEYAGSMTAPPCAEIVTWLVRTEPLQASNEQVRAFVDGIYGSTAGQGNYRTVMPLNGRSVSLRHARYEEAPQPPTGTNVEATTPGASASASGRAEEAATIAGEALRVAQNATNYIADVDSKIHANAEASAGVLPCPTEQAATPAAKAAMDAAVAEVSQEIARAASSSAQEAANAAVAAVRNALSGSTAAAAA